MEVLFYRILILPLFAALIAAVYFLTIGNISAVLFCMLIAAMVSVIQITIVKCHFCGTRPGMRLLFLFPLVFIAFEAYTLGVLFLRNCPKCKNKLT